jgi:formylglycine-generating enzyme required for sulfatase activity
MATYGVAKQSCAGGLDCLGGVSCCETLAVPGGTFPQGSPASDSEAFSDEQPERTVTVSSYALDKYEVTVGRFRKFVKEWDPKAPPPGGAGAHPRIAGSGWRSAWNKRLPKDLADFERLLACDSSSTWTSSTGLNESLPINCVSWYEAFAFCAWDGGRLPTEAEWEYAAAGGEKNWKYPWGADAPTKELAVYNCGFKGPGGPADCFTDDIAPVGSKPNGAGRWGQLDLAGSMSEWVLDAYDEYPEIGSKDFAKTEDIPIRIMRGGSWGSLVRNLRAAYRYYYSSSYRLYIIGFRCAREQ